MAHHELNRKTLTYLLFFFDGVCAKALPAALFESLPVLPSLSTLDAALATLLEVCFLFMPFSPLFQRLEKGIPT